MGYDLNFWKYKEGVYLDNQEVYEALSNGEHVEGLESLPVQQILKDIETAFKGWNGMGSDYENKAGGAFQVFTTEQFVRFDCHGMSGDDMNKITDVLFEHECPLYDPQISQRFDGRG